MYIRRLRRSCVLEVLRRSITKREARNADGAKYLCTSSLDLHTHEHSHVLDTRSMRANQQINLEFLFYHTETPSLEE